MFQTHYQGFLSRAVFPCNVSTAHSVPEHTRRAAQRTRQSVSASPAASGPGYLDVLQLAVTNLKTHPEILQECLKVLFVHWVLDSTSTSQLSWPKVMPYTWKYWNDKIKIVKAAKELVYGRQGFFLFLPLIFILSRERKRSFLKILPKKRKGK